MSDKNRDPLRDPQSGDVFTVSTGICRQDVITILTRGIMPHDQVRKHGVRGGSDFVTLLGRRNWGHDLLPDYDRDGETPAVRWGEGYRVKSKWLVPENPIIPSGPMEQIQRQLDVLDLKIAKATMDRSDRCEYCRRPYSSATSCEGCGAPTRVMFTKSPYQQMLSNGICSINEIREIEAMNDVVVSAPGGIAMTVRRPSRFVLPAQQPDWIRK